MLLASMPSSVSVRRSIRWLPGEAAEPTHTVVLTGESGIFVDVRFKKDSSDLDWAFAGYRHQSLSPPLTLTPFFAFDMVNSDDSFAVSRNTVQFKHHIDSRTLVCTFGLSHVYRLILSF